MKSTAPLAGRGNFIYHPKKIAVLYFSDLIKFLHDQDDGLHHDVLIL